MVALKGWSWGWPKARATGKKGVAPVESRLLIVSAPHGDRHLRDAKGSFISKAFKTDHETRSKQITHTQKNLKREILSLYICVDLNVDLK